MSFNVKAQSNYIRNVNPSSYTLENSTNILPQTRSRHVLQFCLTRSINQYEKSNDNNLFYYLQIAR